MNEQVVSNEDKVTQKIASLTGENRWDNSASRQGIEVKEESSEPEAPVTNGRAEPEGPDQIRRAADGRLSALISERRASRRVEERLAAFEDKFNRFMEALSEPDPEPLPNKEEDPAAYVEEAVTSRLGESLEGIREEMRGLYDWAEKQEVRNEIQSVASTVSAYEARFSQEHPDYNDALNHTYASYHNHLVTSGYDPQEAHAVLYEFASEKMKEALRSGIDPAALIYAEAQRLGYAPKEAEKPKARQPAKPKPQRATSLSAVSGTATGNPGGGYVSREQLFSNFDKATRLDLHQKFPDFYRELEEKGKARLPASYWDRMR